MNDAITHTAWGPRGAGGYIYPMRGRALSATGPLSRGQVLSGARSVAVNLRPLGPFGAARLPSNNTTGGSPSGKKWMRGFQTSGFSDKAPPRAGTRKSAVHVGWPREGDRGAQKRATWWPLLGMNEGSVLRLPPVSIVPAFMPRFHTLFSYAFSYLLSRVGATATLARAGTLWRALVTFSETCRSAFFPSEV